jgi:type I restriction enzyme S subunit
MITDLKPYAEYKESGLPWLGQVPGHWDVSPLAGLARLKSVVNQSERQLLSVYLQRGVVRFFDVAEKRTNATSEDLSKYQAVDPGDFVLNNQQAWRGSVGVSDYSGIVSPAYLVLALSKRYSARYANLLFRDQSMVSQYLVCSKGVGTIQRNLYWPHLKRVGVVVPPPAEQAAIVRFLDWATGRLERAIRAKRKVIALLNEQKHAIIHRAVTRGLDPSVPLKDSGVPWLGEIPKHWELAPNRSFLRVRKILVGERHPSFTLLSLTKRGVIVRDLSEMRGKFSSDMGTSQEVRPGDLVFCLFDVPETPRTIGLSKHAGMITGAYTVMECKRPDIAEFLELFYIAMDDGKLLSPLYSGLRNTIPKERFLGTKTPIPPDGEMAAILNAVQDRTASLNTTISRLEREISLLREYRTRLVADVVTGKLDVRAAAAALPDEALLDDVAVSRDPDDDAYDTDDFTDTEGEA